MTIHLTLALLCFVLLITVGVLIGLVYRIYQKQLIVTQPTQIVSPPILRDRSIRSERRVVLPKKRYANSTLRQRDKVAYQKRIIDHLEQSKVYRQPDLTIKKLAQQVQLPPHYVSQVLNEQLNSSFLEVINRYRIEEATKLLQAPESRELPLVAIGRKVGFQAKSTFYAVFKKYVHCSPGDYRKRFCTKK